MLPYLCMHAWVYVCSVSLYLSIKILGNDQKSLQTISPAGYRVFWNYSPGQIPTKSLCLYLSLMRLGGSSITLLD